MQIIFPSYVSDGPGFAGRIELSVLGTKLVQKLVGEDVVEEVIQLPFEVGEFTAVRFALESDFPIVRKYLSSHMNWIGNDLNEHVDVNRCAIFETSSGHKGFILLWGEPCYMDMCFTDRAVSIDELMSPVQCALLGPFPALEAASPVVDDIRTVLQGLGCAQLKATYELNSFSMSKLDNCLIMRDDLLRQAIKYGGITVQNVNGGEAKAYGYPAFPLTV